MLNAILDLLLPPANEVWGKVIFLPAATKLGQGNIFTSVCQEFCPQGEEGVCLSACWDTPDPQAPWDQTPPGSRHPPDQAPPRPGTPPAVDPLPPSADPPRPGTTPPSADPPRPGTHPPQEADCIIQSMSGQYTSYWNAFLLHLSVILFTGGSTWAGTPLPWAGTPPAGTPPRQVPPQG